MNRCFTLDILFEVKIVPYRLNTIGGSGKKHRLPVVIYKNNMIGEKLCSKSATIKAILYENGSSRHILMTNVYIMNDYFSSGHPTRRAIYVVRYNKFSFRNGIRIQLRYLVPIRWNDRRA